LDTKISYEKTIIDFTHPVAEAGTKEVSRVSSARNVPRRRKENGNGEDSKHVNGDRERIISCDALDMTRF